MIYFIKNTGTSHIKVGYAANPKARLNGMQTANSYELVLLGMMEGSVKDEWNLHSMLDKHRVRGEWYYPCPKLEKLIADCNKPVYAYPPIADENRAYYGSDGIKRYDNS